MTPTSVGAAPLPSLNSVINRLLDRLYWGIPDSPKPITEKHISKDERNQQICLRFATGGRLEEIADEFDISFSASRSDHSPLVLGVTSLKNRRTT